MQEFIYLEHDLCYTYVVGLFFPQNSEQFSFFPPNFPWEIGVRNPENQSASSVYLIGIRQSPGMEHLPLQLLIFPRGLRVFAFDFGNLFVRGMLSMPAGEILIESIE